MAPLGPAPIEVDVFTGPHSRMKQLMEHYSAKLSATDFSSYIELKLLLCNLIATFKEFITHEKIENECIMQKLKNRLRFRQIEVKEVTKAHSDNRLGEMLMLFEEDCKAMNHCHLAPGEMQIIGESLREALQDFNQDFLPHMQEEEELFQPLLMEYFTYEELKIIKSDVIQRHLQLTKYKGEEKDDSAVEIEGKQEGVDVGEEPAKVLSLPTEITVEIFSYLGPRDLLRCAQVCSSWSGLARDGSLWKTLHPVRWAQGDWKFHQISDEPSDPDPPQSDCDDSDDDLYDIARDEDKDFDESQSSGSESDASDSSQRSRIAMAIRREVKMLDDMSKYLIPYIGSGVENVVLAHSKGLSNGVVYRILVNCPNLKYLDLSMTKVNDIAFKGLGKNRAGSRLKYVDFSGCTSISDSTLHHLSRALSEPSHQDNVSSKGAAAAVDKNGKPKTKNKCGSDCGCQDIGENDSYGIEGARLKTPNNDRTNVGHLVSDPKNNHSHSSCDDTSKTDCCHSNNSQRAVHSCHSNTDRSSLMSDHHVVQTNRTGVAHGDQTGLSDDALRTSRHGSPSTSRLPEEEEDGQDESKPINTVAVERSLEYLSLSGCYKITDKGLRHLAEAELINLHHLDLSGCLGLTATGISKLAYACPLLDHEEFFYCDNILEGPFAETASGCQNLACGSRVCCRGGE